jgi:hypothetical protein
MKVTLNVDAVITPSVDQGLYGIVGRIFLPPEVRPGEFAQKNGALF